MPYRNDRHDYRHWTFFLMIPENLLYIPVSKGYERPGTKRKESYENRKTVVKSTALQNNAVTTVIV